ncbi:MAG: glutathione S-transferase family protein [Pseudomonadota bacterium]
MSSLKIHGFPQSTFVRTACMAAREKGVDYEVVPLAFREPSHAAVHPFLKMPAMENGSVKLFETLAIAGYIDEAFNGPPLQPSDPVDKARMRQWISAGNDYLYDDLVGAGLDGDEATEEALETAEKDLAIVDQALSDRPYLAGQTVSLADLFLAPMIAYGCSAGKAAELVSANPHLAAWRDRMFQRDSFKATKA